MQSKVIQDGKFEVFENGEVYRIKNGTKTKPSISWQVTKNKKYGWVTYSENGKQQRYLVHRLVAEAFCENPNNYKLVYHVDGNSENNNASNLKWVTAKMSVQLSNDLGLCDRTKLKVPCEVCGQLTESKTMVCGKCRAELKRETLKMQKCDELADKLEEINFEILKPEHKEIILLRMEGKTLEEIGRIFGVTRERIRQIIERAFIKSRQPYKKKQCFKKSNYTARKLL